MHVTVAICSHNRAQSLRRTLDGLRRLRVPATCTWELIVVLSACTDASPSAAAEFERDLPLRTVNEARAGLSVARNRAIDEAEGVAILWTDDDVLVDDHWLEAYVEGLERHPDAAFFGGPIALQFEERPPTWLQNMLPQVGSVFAQRNLGAHAIALDASRLPFGANMAIRRQALLECRFDDRYGHHASRVRLGEETDVFVRLLNKGHSGRWVPAAAVTHIIPPERTTPAHLGAYWRARGEHIGASDDLANAPSDLRLALWWARSGMSCALRRSVRPTDVWIARYLATQGCRGMLVGRARRRVASLHSWLSPLLGRVSRKREAQPDR